MTETSETSSPDTQVKHSHLCAELKQMIKRKRLTQKQLVDRLAERGIKISEPTMTRIMKGDRSLSEGELHVICEILDEADQFPRLREHLRKEQGKASQPKPPRPRLAPRDVLKQHPIAALAVALVLVGAAVTTAILLFGGTTPTGSAPAPGGGTGKPGNAQNGACDQYEVAARDLWLRDQYGAPQVELSHGQRVTVTNRASSYWAVTVEGGQNGWVDHTYLKPLC